MGEKHEVTTLAELDRGPQRVTINDKTFLLFKKGHEIYAYRNHCPHQGGPVVTGHIDLEDETVTCPWHGWKFELEGGKNPFSKPQFVRSLHQAETAVENEVVYLFE